MTLADTIATAVVPPGLQAGAVAREFTGAGDTGDVFAVAGLAASSIAEAASALARYAGRDSVTVDRRLSSLWFHRSIHPLDSPSPQNASHIRDEITGDYRAADGWIRLHCNAPTHRAAVERVLGRLPDRRIAAGRVERWKALELQESVVEAGGAAAMMLDADQWAGHPQGQAVAREPLVQWRLAGEAPLHHRVDPGRPLAGLKVLDLTRILAGPVSTRFLAAFGARVLRIDPPGWDEGGNIPEMTPGKHCATLDLRDAAGLRALTGLIAEADILVHGYRSDALERLGIGDRQRRNLNPGLIDVALDAYGWSGPWRARRGFDSLVQMSSGIAAFGGSAAGVPQPRPMTVQALDHATGYLLAASVLNALCLRRDSGLAAQARLSLAATAELLKSHRPERVAGGFGPAIAPSSEADLDPFIEQTDWGPARRLTFPAQIAGFAARWDSPAVRLHSAPPVFDR